MTRAIGIVRVSRSAGREGPSFVSPVEQRERIEEACARDKYELVEVHEEIDVSGGTPLAKRQGLTAAVEAVEAGGADVVLVAYFDRLVRSLRVQDEVVSRVEAAGGRVMAIDFGQITGATAAQWLSGTMIGAVHEYYRRSSKERNAEAQMNAVARGVAPYGAVPLGYVRGDDKVFVPDPDVAPLVVRAYEMRAAGETIMAVREFLKANGVERSYHGVEHVLGSRAYLGEVHFGELENLEAHEPIVDRTLWLQVQRIRETRGTRPKSDALLARLGVLRCGTCNSRMSIGTQKQNGRTYPFYKCNPLSDCPNRMAISARIVEEAVVAKVQELLVDVEGRASAAEDVQVVELAAANAQRDLDAAIRAFAGVEGEVAARDRIDELREIRDKAEAELEQLSDLRTAVVVRAHEHWDMFTLDEQRALVKATIKRVTVAPGRGAGRISIEHFAQ